LTPFANPQLSVLFNPHSLVYTPLAALWLVGYVFIGRLPFRRRNLVTAALTLIAVAAPIYYTLNGMGWSAARRISEGGVTFTENDLSELLLGKSPQSYLNGHLRPAFYTYLNNPDGSLFYGASTAAVLPIHFFYWAVLCCCGIGVHRGAYC
jgi:hypothetical protein